MIVERTTVELATPTGPMRVAIHHPMADEQYPGVVLFSEIYQETGPIARMAAMVAGHGFIVAVPEIFHELEPAGTVLPYDKVGTAAGNHHKTAKPVSAYDADARAVVDHLALRPDVNGAIGALGVCIGGHLAFRCAFDARVAATACFYATDLHTGKLGLGGDDSLARAGDIHGALAMIWGRQDPHVPDEGRAKIQTRLVESKRDFSWYELSAAHAFMRDEGPRYDPALALACYRTVLDLFARL